MFTCISVYGLAGISHPAMNVYNPEMTVYFLSSATHMADVS
jgi:hypothetical protein